MVKEKYKHPVFLLLISMAVGSVGGVFFEDQFFGMVLQVISFLLLLVAFIQYWRS